MRSLKLAVSIVVAALFTVLTLEGVLGGLLKIPALPAVLPTVTC